MPKPSDRVWVVEISPDGSAFAYVDKLEHESETDSLSSEGHFRTDVRTPTRKAAIATARERLSAHYGELARQRLAAPPVSSTS